MSIDVFVGAPKALVRSIALVAVLNTVGFTGEVAAAISLSASTTTAFTSSINTFNSADFVNGVWRRTAGLSVPASSAAISAFKPGVQIRFADGQVRTITRAYTVGADISIYVDGGLLDGNEVGAPRTVSTVPMVAAAPASTATSGYTAPVNNFVNEDWENGIYRKAAGFSVPDTVANQAAFAVGASVQLADGQVRKISAVYEVDGHLSVMLSGATLSNSAVGYPKTVSVVSDTTGATTPSLTVTPTPAPAPTTPVVTDGSGINLVGVNFGSGVFDPSNVPGLFNKNYTYADESYYKRHSELGFKLVRLGFLWERIQPKLGTELNAAELARIKQSLDFASKHGIKVILDMHNYYRYYGKLINSPEVPRAQFSATWRRLAQELSKHPALYGYGLMNEPYNTGNGLWPKTALEAAQAIRTVDSSKWIMVAGDHFSNALFWERVNTQLISDPWMRDPKNNLVFEAHQYLDKDHSGTYTNRAETFDPMIGVQRVKPWVEWLKKHNLRGYLGEHGISDFSPSAVVAMDNLLTYLQQNCIPSSYWAAGPWWGDNHMALDVSTNKARPQLPVLQKHAATKKTCSTIGPM